MFIDREAIYKSLTWHSSPVDWCEGNYKVVPYIVEFYNTLSNVFFIIIPPLLIYLFRGFSRTINPGIQFIWIMFIVVGFSSMYFHGTLSLMGQLLDEISILWVYALGVAIYCPTYYMPSFAKSRALFSLIVTILTMIFTILSVWRPYINAFVQMFCLVIPIVMFLFLELQKIKKTDKNVYKLGIKSLTVGLTAVTIWFNDRIFCSFYTQFGITYLHAIWHVLSFISSYTACVLGAYFYIKLDHPEVPCKITYWPNENGKIFGFPYVKIIEKSKKRRT